MGGNDLAEAAYPGVHEDADGEPLDGDRRDRPTLTSPPPAEAFWSFTMYDTSYDGTAGYLVENPIGRYLINSTTDGLVRDDDGSLTVYIQHDEPDAPEGWANWLPAPAGPSCITLRIPVPDQSVIDGAWEPPPIERIDS